MILDLDNITSLSELVEAVKMLSQKVESLENELVALKGEAPAAEPEGLAVPIDLMLDYESVAEEIVEQPVVEAEVELPEAEAETEEEVEETVAVVEESDEMAPEAEDVEDEVETVEPEAVGAAEVVEEVVEEVAEEVVEETVEDAKAEVVESDGFDFPEDDLPDGGFGALFDIGEPEFVPVPKQRKGKAKPEPAAPVAVIDAMIKKYQWRTAMPAPEVKDVRSAISLNDRVMFIAGLFREDFQLYNDTLTKINSMPKLDDVVAYVEAVFPEWDMDSDVVYRFMMAVRRKVRM